MNELHCYSKHRMTVLAKERKRGVVVRVMVKIKLNFSAPLHTY